MKIKTEQEMLDFGARLGCELQFAKKTATVLELVGDVGTGKTTFTRGLARGLGLTEAVTSPSYTIAKTYALPQGRTLVHYDFYRLPEPGLMAEDLAETIADPRNVVVIEWGESVADWLPEERISLQFAYGEDGTHEVVLLPVGSQDEIASAESRDQEVSTLTEDIIPRAAHDLGNRDQKISAPVEEKHEVDK